MMIQSAIRMFDEVWERKYAFFGVFFVIITLSYGLLYAVDFIPEPPAEEPVPALVANERPREVVADPVVAVDPLPVRIIIDALDKDIAVLNPESRDIADLDAALLDGVVRHPDSSDFSEKGNMFLFGHSSYLPNVLNKNFQAFNGIQKLEWGDTIRVQSGDMEYTYRVENVYKALASQAEIELDNSAPRLTLVTCNSFGSKDDRFVVEADLISQKPL